MKSQYTAQVRSKARYFGALSQCCDEIPIASTEPGY
jgi:hypothetical protein